MNTLGPRGLFMYRLLGTCMIIWALECSFACCETGTRVFIHLYHDMHWAIIGVPCSVYMNMEIISWVCIYFYHFKMLSNYDDMLTTTLITISTFRCSMPVNINMKKASTHSFLWTSFNLYPPPLVRKNLKLAHPPSPHRQKSYFDALQLIW